MVLSETGRLYLDNISETGDFYKGRITGIGRLLLSQTYIQYFTDTIALATSAKNNLVNMFMETLTVTTSATNSLQRNLVEAINVLCSTTHNLTRNLLDTITTTDIFSGVKGTVKYFTESVAMTASMGARSLQRSLISVISVAQTLKRSITRIMDVVTLLMQDLRSLATTKAFYQPIVVANNVYKSITRSMQQNVIITSIYSKSIALYKYLTETLVITDYKKFNVARNLIDTITVTSAYTRMFYKYLIDNISIILIRGQFSITHRLVQAINITLDYRKAFYEIYVQPVIVAASFNWLRPVLRTVRYTVASGVKKATKMFLGGEENE